MSSPAESSLSRFEALDARIRSAVESVAATDPNPADPFRGLYISDELAVELAREGPAARARRPDRARRAPARADATSRRRCWRSARRPSWARTTAGSTRYLHDDVTRKLASPRLSPGCSPARRLAPRDVLDCFDHDAAAAPRRAPCACSTRGSQPPLADRLLKVSDRLAALPARQPGSTSRRATAACGACRCPSDDPGAASGDRGAASRCSPPRAGCRSWSPAPTPRRSSPPRSARPLLLVDASRRRATPDLMRDAALDRGARGPAALLRRPRRRSSRTSTLRVQRAARGARRARHWSARASPRRGRRARRADGDGRRGAACRASPSGETAWAATTGRRRRRRRRGEVPALDRPDRATPPRSRSSPRPHAGEAAPGSDRPRPRRAPRLEHAPRRARLAARPARSAGTTS